ncbi:MAG: hypothetical protein Kow0025_15060 [Thermodesulfovibrionales bacterium]
MTGTKRAAGLGRAGLALAALWLLLMGGTASAQLTARANHDHIKIDLTYHGSTVSVRGTSEPGVDLVVKISSPHAGETLKMKKRAGGLLWMNAGDLDLGNVPGLYLLASTRRAEDILSQEELDRYAIGYGALERLAEAKGLGPGEDKSEWFREFLKLKESSRMYSSAVGDFSVTPEDGKERYYVLFDWPHRAPSGDYSVTVYAVRDGKVVEKAETGLLVEEVGVVKALDTMARRHGALYGAAAIFIALGAGLGVGMIFKRGGGR